MRRNSIQTGLRVPEGQYDRLQKLAERMGVSLNALMLILIDFGIKHLELDPEESSR